MCYIETKKVIENKDFGIRKNINTIKAGLKITKKKYWMTLDVRKNLVYRVGHSYKGII